MKKFVGRNTSIKVEDFDLSLEIDERNFFE